MFHRPRFHYAWVVLAAVMGINAVSAGIRLSFGVFIDPLVKQFGWSHGDISLAYTLAFIAGIPMILAVGWLGDRISTRTIVIIASVVASLGIVLTGTISHLWQFYLYFGIIAGGLGTATFMALLPVTITHWFHRKQGIALGLMWSSLSWGPALLAPLMRWSLETAGWRQSFTVLGIVSGVVMLAGAFFLRGRPEDVGLTPYGGQAPLTGKVETSSASLPPTLSFKQVATKFSFWGLVMIHFLGCVGHSIPIAHMVSIGTFAGLHGLVAAGGLTVFSLTSLVSRFGMSLVSEAKGARFTLTWALFLQAAPSFLLFLAGNPWGFYAYGILFGLGYGGEMVGFPIFNRQLYGYNAPLNMLYSAQMVGAMLGMAAGGWIGGVLFDVSGNYTWTILVSIMANFLGLGIALLLPRYRRVASA